MLSVTDQDFVSSLALVPPEPPPEPEPYIISGRVTSTPQGTIATGGPSLSDVNQILLSVTGALRQMSVLTDNDGYYQFSGLPNGSYVVSIYKLQGGRVPTNQTVVINNANVVNVNFAVTDVPVISGTIRLAGAGMENVTINFSGPRIGASVSLANGTYSITPAWPGTYTVTPQMLGYTFTPTSRTVNTVTGTMTAQDFTATPV